MKHSEHHELLPREHMGGQKGRKARVLMRKSIENKLDLQLKSMHTYEVLATQILFATTAWITNDPINIENTYPQSNHNCNLAGPTSWWDISMMCPFKLIWTQITNTQGVGRPASNGLCALLSTYAYNRRSMCHNYVTQKTQRMRSLTKEMLPDLKSLRLVYDRK